MYKSLEGTCVYFAPNTPGLRSRPASLLPILTRALPRFLFNPSSAQVSFSVRHGTHVAFVPILLCGSLL